MSFDVVVIGAGPGGYVCAIRCAQLGLKTLCVDNYKHKQRPSLGGTCLNVGCIPSKALLSSSEHYHELKKNALSSHGINISALDIDIDKMLERKEQIISKNSAGIKFLFNKNKVTYIHAKAQVKARKDGLYKIELLDNPLDSNGKEITENSEEIKDNFVHAKHVVIATGSAPASILGLEFNDRILNNEGALDLKEVPKGLGIIGAGAIGLEMASVWSRLGSEVVVFEASENFLPAVDEQVSAAALRHLRSEFDIRLGAQIKNIKSTDCGVEVVSVDQTFNFDKLILSVGRKPLASNVFDSSLGLGLDERGFVLVDEECKSNLENVWAIGDVVRGPMLAHKASLEGVAVAERIVGQKPLVHLDLIPGVIYTDPEIAFVGSSEQSLRQRGISYRKGVAQFGSNGRALAMDRAIGFVKVLVSDDDRLLGVHIFGPYAGELISEAVLALNFYASSEDVARCCHPHPSLSEVLQEAMQAAHGRAIH